MCGAIAEQRAFGGGLGEGGLHIDDDFGFGGRGRVAVANQLEHVRHMLEVACAQRFRTVVVIQVILAVGHAETALPRGENHLRAVLEVLQRAESESEIDAHALKTGYFGLQPRDIADGCDALEL
jgi:hypothetical protein